MRYHHTKNKGDLGVAKVIADLIDKGYGILLPLSEHLPYDIVAADENGELIKIQAKYRSGEAISLRNQTSWADKNGTHRVDYSPDAFDFFAAYSPKVEAVIYIHWNGNFKNLNIRTSLPNSATPYYWYEDFTELTKTMPEKRKNDTIPYIRKKSSSLRKTKIPWPSDDDLIEMIKKSSFLQVGKELGVSDNAVRKRLKSRGFDTKSIKSE